MNLWFRMLWLLLASPFRARLEPPFGVSRLSFRVWPNDLDINMHMNNGRFLTIMDIGRFDLILRMGLWKAARRHGWMPVLSAANVIFRRELRPFRTFVLETKILWWSGTHMLMEHRILIPGADDGEVVAARAVMHGGFYQRAKRRFVPMSEIATELRIDGEDLPMTSDIETMLAASRALRDLPPTASRE
ncbi:MAG: thioesterase family protein [Hyphomicrobiales bacterium]|nr:thioesterase family protein [Hyphomicrobiales bacterium]